MPNLAHTSLPEYVSGLLNPASWSNQLHSILAYGAIKNKIEKVTLNTGFIPTIGVIYLADSASSGGFNGGNIYIWLTPSSVQGFSPDPGCVIGNFTKNIAGNNWTNTVIADLSDQGTFIYSAGNSQTLSVPNNFNGKADIIVHSTGSVLTLNAGSGRTGFGKIGVPLNPGIYQVYQDLTKAVI